MTSGSILSTLYYTEGGMSCLTPLPRLDNQRMHTPRSARRARSTRGFPLRATTVALRR